MENDLRQKISRYSPKFIAGITYGLSFPLTLIILDYWLKSIGISNSAIGMFSLLQWPFTLKFVWGALIDNCDIWILSNIFGRRKSWIIISYIMLIIGILGMAFSTPQNGLYMMIFFASLVTLADGCRNVAMYPYQVDKSNKQELGYVASVVSLGHRIGMIAIKIITLYVAGLYNWKTAYIIASILIALSFVVTIHLKEPQHIENKRKNFLENFKIELNMHVILILILYKAADFMTQKMSRAFCIEIGFTPIEIANIVQIGGTGAVILGAFISGYIIKRNNIFRAMFLVGVAHMLALFSHVLLAIFGNNLSALAIISFFDGITGGAVTTAFVAFLYGVSKSGTAYALSWAIHGCAGMIFMALSGIIADHISWQMYFSLIPLVAAPGLVCVFKKTTKTELPLL